MLKGAFGYKKSRLRMKTGFQLFVLHDHADGLPCPLFE